MDDAATPQGAPEDTAGSDPVDTRDEAPGRGEPVAEYAPQPREETPPRLDLERDPFTAAQAFPVLDPEPLIPAIAGPSADAAVVQPAPDAEAVMTADTTTEEDAFGGDENVAVPDAQADTGLDAEPGAGETAASSDETADAPTVAALVVGDGPESGSDESGEQAVLSLDDMVGELTSTDETGAVEEACAEEASAEAAVPHAVAQASEDGAAPEDAAGADTSGSWRDAVAEEPEAAEPVLARRRLRARLPFWVYGGVWAVFVGVMTYLMWPLSDEPFVNSIHYMYMVLGGAALLASGVVLAVIVWAVARAGVTAQQREGLVGAIALRTMGWSTVGVILWLAGMYALDLHRTGVIG